MYILFNSVISTTLDISLIDSLLIGILAFLIALPFVRKRSTKTKLWLLGALVYGSFLLFLTIPIVLSPYPDSFANKLIFVAPDILWNPVDSISGVTSLSDFIRLIIGNFILLMPLAVLVLTRNPNHSLDRFFVLPLCTSLAIEVLQLVGNVLIGYSSRTVEMLDIILNASGACFCFCIIKMVMKAKRLQKRTQ